jgi:hypothetical protein
MESVFMDKSNRPKDLDLKDKLGTTFLLWSNLAESLHETLVAPSGEWNFPGKKYGWSFRMKSKKRNIIYFLPRDGYFKVAFVFGQKAMIKIMESNVSSSIKAELHGAKVYAEGRGIRIDIKDSSNFDDIKTLIKIKAEN